VALTLSGALVQVAAMSAVESMGLRRWAWVAWVAVGGALPCPVLAAPLAATPIARLDLPVWRARFEQKQGEIRDGRYDLVYYGDSITQNFERAGKLPQADWPSVWRRFYGDRHALNLGFKGDTTASLLWRIEHGEGDVRGPHGDPKAAIVLIGANNLGRLHWSAADTLAGIEADIGAIHAHLKQTRILLVSVLPSDRSEWVTQTTGQINAGLARRYDVGADPWVTFVDVSHVLMRDGRTDRGLFIDPLLTPPDPPLHPNVEGATRVAEAIEPALAGIMGDRRH
jgi:lysophospholipase L1-like esterase